MVQQQPLLLGDDDTSDLEAALSFLDEYDHLPLVPASPEFSFASSTSSPTTGESSSPSSSSTSSSSTIGRSPSWSLNPAEEDGEDNDVANLLSLIPLSPVPAPLLDEPVFPILPQSPLRVVPTSTSSFFPISPGLVRTTMESALTAQIIDNQAEQLHLQLQLRQDQKKKAKPRPKRPANYNSNKARDERRKELLYLRQRVVELEEELTRIQKRPRNAATISLLDDDCGSSCAPNLVKHKKPGVWEEIAEHQLEERRRSERENARLKLVLENQIKVAKSLEAILNKRSNLRDMETVGVGKQKRVYPNRSTPIDRVVFSELKRSVEACFLEIDTLFESMGIADLESSFRDAQMREGENGLFMEIFANKVLPFTVNTASEVVWQHFARNIEHIPFRQYYERTSKNVGVDAEDTILENIGMELKVNGTTANFRVKQVLRRYREKDRVVVVWCSIIDPFEFLDKPLSGVFFREKGYMLLKKPSTLDPKEYSVLKTCHIITPDLTTGSLCKDDEIVGQLTDFVLSGTAASTAASYQMIENVLMGEAMNRKKRGHAT